MTTIDISPEAVELLCAIHEGYGQHGTVATLRALSAALARFRAETAAAYEVAAKAAMGHCYAIMSATDADARAALIAVSIRAIATPDQTAALDKLIAEAVGPYVEALRVLIDHTHECERELTEALYHADFCGESRPLTDARAILAAIKKGGA